MDSPVYINLFLNPGGGFGKKLITGGTYLTDRFGRSGKSSSMQADTKEIEKDTLPENMEISGGVLIKYMGNAAKVQVPHGVFSVGDSAFFGCNSVKQVVLPMGVRQIGRSAFAECMNLREINFPEGLEVISDAAFEHCPSLVRIEIPDSVRFIGRMAFSKCTELRRAKLPRGLPEIFHGMFMGDVKLETLILPEQVTRIGDFALYFCKSLEELYLPDLTVDIQPHTLYGCTGLKRGYISRINLARYSKQEAMLFALLYLSERKRYSCWEGQIYEMFIREFKEEICSRILEAKSLEALSGFMELNLLDELGMDTWIQQARKAKDIEFTAKLLQYRQEMFSAQEDMWEI